MESKLRILKKIIIIMIVVICVLSMVYFLIIKKLDQNVNDFANNTPTDTTPIELQKDIQEVKNAYNAYEQIDKVNPYSVEDLKKIHGTLTFLIEKDAGKLN